jgi:hypothetical protein
MQNEHERKKDANQKNDAGDRRTQSEIRERHDGSSDGDSIRRHRRTHCPADLRFASGRRNAKHGDGAGQG